MNQKKAKAIRRAARKEYNQIFANGFKMILESSFKVRLKYALFILRGKKK